MASSTHIYSKTCTSVDDADDSEEFDATVAALDALGVKGAELGAIFRAAAAACTGHVQFSEDGDGSKITTQSELDTAIFIRRVVLEASAPALYTGSVSGRQGRRCPRHRHHANTPRKASTLRHALATPSRASSTGSSSARTLDKSSPVAIHWYLRHLWL